MSSKIGGIKTKNPAPAFNRVRESFYLGNFKQKSLSHLILRFFCKTLSQHPTGTMQAIHRFFSYE